MLLFVNMLVIGITSRALFDLDESHSIFEDKGLEAYKDFQVSNENIPLNPGQAFPLVNKLLALNNKINKDKKLEEKIKKGEPLNHKNIISGIS